MPPRTMEALSDIAWGILLDKRIQEKYETWLSDAMPKPKREYLVPVFDQETWDQLMQAIREAAEVWKAQVIKEAQKPEERPWLENPAPEWTG